MSTPETEAHDDIPSEEAESLLPQISPWQPRKTLPMFPPFSQPPPAPTTPVETQEEGPAFFTPLEQERCLAALEEVELCENPGGSHER